jgi:hypothetical protein
VLEARESVTVNNNNGTQSLMFLTSSKHHGLKKVTIRGAEDSNSIIKLGSASDDVTGGGQL